MIKDTDNFIISYDYKLAPENKLDKIIEESIKAFEFIYFFSEKLFGIEIENYVLMGDSAGGLLSMNLVNHIIRKNYRKPKEMVLIYPCKLIK
jgi:acetyl esterase/lipase